LQRYSYQDMVKKLLAFSLLFLLLFNFMGYYIIFEVNRYQIRKEMEPSTIGLRPITVIEIADSDTCNALRWVNDREFVYHGNLYDVIYTSPRSTKTVYYCVHDKKEENLVKAFQHANTSKLTQALWNLIVHSAVQVPLLTIESEPPLLIIYPNSIIQLCQVSIPPDCPPPRNQSGFARG